MKLQDYVPAISDRLAEPWSHPFFIFILSLSFPYLSLFLPFVHILPVFSVMKNSLSELDTKHVADQYPTKRNLMESR
jgi:hypothetical protein